MAGPRYIADPSTLLRKVELDGLTAIFHVPSGMTHLLAPPAPQILDALADDPADAEELTTRLTAGFEIDGGVEQMAARLAELESAGLVRQA